MIYLKRVEEMEDNKKTLKELCTIRDNLRSLIEHKDWLGDTEILEKALVRVLKEIEEYIKG